VDERYRERRRTIESFFSLENRVPDSVQVSDSPSGTFRLETCHYSTGQKTWNYSRGIVKRIDDDTIIADVKRNFGHFWHTWVGHADGNEYLLCGEDYQGYSIVNLTAGTCKTFFPEEGYKGRGFCWTAAYPSPDTFVLAVDGCYWACPYDVVFYDFRKPEDLPLGELLRVSNVVDRCEGWTDNETFVLTREVEVRKSDNSPYEALDEVEQAELDADPSLVETRKETLGLRKPVY
jgi:hypothetical protein